MDTISLLSELVVLRKEMDNAEAFLEELVEYLLVTCKDDDYITPEVICRKLAKYGYVELENGYWVNPLADRKDEPRTSCKTCRFGEVDEGYVRCAYYSKADRKTEPQTDCSWK